MKNHAKQEHIDRSSNNYEDSHESCTDRIEYDLFPIAQSNEFIDPFHHDWPYW